MLGIFNKSVASIPIPSYLKLERPIETEEEEVVNLFCERHQDSFKVDLRPLCFFSATPDLRDSLISRCFAVKDDIFAFLQGKIENTSGLSHLDVNEEEQEAMIIIDGFRSSRLGESMYWSRLLEELVGKFSLIMFDNQYKRLFAATDNDEQSALPFFWGVDAKDNLVLTTDQHVAKKACGEAYGLFPKGCYISSMGVRRFDAPEILLDPVSMLKKFQDEIEEIEEM